MARKKRKLDDGKDEHTGGDSGFGGNTGTATKSLGRPIGKLRLEMPSQKENQQVVEPEKDDGSAVGMISPESITAA